MQNIRRKRIGLYWNGKAGGDIALRAIGKYVERHFTGARVELIVSGIPGVAERVEAAKQFDAVVGATGD